MLTWKASVCIIKREIRWVVVLIISVTQRLGSPVGLKKMAKRSDGATRVHKRLYKCCWLVNSTVQLLKEAPLWHQMNSFQTHLTHNMKRHRLYTISTSLYPWRICTLSSSSDSWINVQWAQSPCHNGQRKLRRGEDWALINPSFHFQDPPPPPHPPHWPAPSQSAQEETGGGGGSHPSNQSHHGRGSAPLRELLLKQALFHAVSYLV